MYEQGFAQGVRRTALTLLTLVVLAALTPLSALADSITLAWDPSPGTNIAGYNLYFGVASGNYTNMVSAGNATTVMVSGLVEGTTYFFAATAYDTSGVESDFSSETNYLPPFSGNQPPVILAIGSHVTPQNTATAAIPVTISDPETPAASLTLSGSSSNPALVPQANIQFGGSAGNRTVTLVPLAGQSGIANITLTVSDGTNNASTAFQLTVTSPAVPTISAIPNQSTAQNTSTAPIPFTIGDSGFPLSSLLVSGSSSNPALVPNANITFGGSGANRTVTLMPASGQTGNVTITITVSDGSATASQTFALAVQPGSGSSMVSLTTNGSGTISPNLSPSKLVAGRTYTVTAIPKAGQEFAGWTGSIISSAPRLTFKLDRNLALQANFVPSPFPAVSGAYNGLFYEDTQLHQSSSGFFSLAVTKRGKYTGRFQIGARRSSFSGHLTLGCFGTNAILSRAGATINLQFNLGTNAQVDQVSGQLSDGSWLSTLSGNRSTFNARTNPAPQAGTYTLLIPGQTGDASLPAGYSFGTVRVTTSGRVSFAGTLADGVKTSQSAPLSNSGEWPLYASLYSGQGSLLSWLTFASQTTRDVGGDLSWIKLPIIKARYYPGGFSNIVFAAGSAYHRPTATTDPILNLTSGSVAFCGGNLSAGITNSITIALNKVSNQSPDALKLTFSPSLGIFQGTLANPAGGRPLPFNGAVFQKLNTGYGILMGASESSSVVIGQ